MSRDFQIGDLVYMPGAPKGHDTLGRVFRLRDGGFEVYVGLLSNPNEWYYTHYDQLDFASVLDLMISDDGH